MHSTHGNTYKCSTRRPRLGNDLTLLVQSENVRSTRGARINAALAALDWGTTLLYLFNLRMCVLHVETRTNAAPAALESRVFRRAHEPSSIESHVFLRCSRFPPYRMPYIYGVPASRLPPYYGAGLGSAEMAIKCPPARWDKKETV